MEQSEEIEGVQFETESYKAVKFYKQTDTPKIVQLTMKYSGGLIKEENQAHWTLFGLVIVVIVVSLFLFFRGGGISDKALEQQKLYPPGSPAIR